MEQELRFSFVHFGYYSVMVHHITYVTAPFEVSTSFYTNMDKLPGTGNLPYAIGINIGAGIIFQTYATMGEAISAHATLMNEIEHAYMMKSKSDVEADK